MPTLGEWIGKLRYFGRGSRFEGDLDDEVRFHIETRSQELEESGLSPADAFVQARREFGSVTRMREDSRAAWQFGWLEDLLADLHYALRAFRRSPAFTLTAVLSLALGIGANSAIFTALDAVLWKPLPVADPQTLVTFSISRANGGDTTDLPLAFIRQLRESGIFDGLTIASADGLSFTYDDRAERIVGEVVSPNFFTLLGVRPILGRAFTPDVQAGRWAAEAVLSYNFWKRRFAGDPSVLGRTIHLNTYPFKIVGIAPPEFFGLTRGSGYEIRIPILPDGQELAQIYQLSGRLERGLTTFARLKPGVNMAQAEAAAGVQLQEFLHATPLEKFRKAGFRKVRLMPGARGNNGDLSDFHAPLYVLLVLVAIVLLIACANVANMLLARATARARELAIRASMGAGRFRLIRQMLTESMLLSLAGGMLGIGVASWASGLLFHFLPQGHINIVLDLHPDRRALLFTCAVSLATGLLFGLASALQATRGDFAAALRTDSAASIGERSARLRNVLVVAQVTFSLVLLIVTGVFVRTLFDLRPADYRSNPDRVLLFTMKPQREIYTPERRHLLVSEIVRRVAEVPGVQSAAFAEDGPLGYRQDREWVEVPGHHPVQIDVDSVTPGFFDTVGIHRLAGSDFTAGDTPSSPRVAIVNQAFVRALFNNQNPIGRTLSESNDQFKIVGVVADTRYYDVHTPPPPGAWFALQQLTPYLPTLHVRISGSDSAAMIAAIRHQFDTIDKGFPVFNIKTMEMRIEDSLARERMVANLSGAFGILALALAAVGLYGVLSYSVTRRTREIGIRMALGSGSGLVLWLVAREALLLVGCAGAAGVMIAIAAIRVLSRYLAGISSANGAILVGCAAAMVIISAVAVSIPAARACRVDPLTALRHE